MADRGPKMANGVWKGVYSQIFWHFKQLSLNKFFDLSTPSSFWWVNILGLVADGVWKRVYFSSFGHSKQLLLNKFLIQALLLLEK